METHSKSDILVYDTYDEFVENMLNYGGKDDGEGIKEVKFLETEQGYSFLYGDKLWRFQEGELENLMNIQTEHYEWIDSDSIIYGQNGKIVSYHTASGRKEELFDNYNANGTFILSEDKKTIVYEGSNKHGLYQYSFETGESEYIANLSGGSPRIAISPNNKFVVYYDSYYTISHSAKGKLYILDINNKNKKILKKWDNDIVGGIVWH